MNLVETARAYCTARRIASTPIHSVNRFVRIIGMIPIAEVATEHCEEFRKRCIGKMSAWTIEKTLVDLVTIVESTGRKLDKGRPLRRDRPIPKPTPMTFLDAAWPYMSPWIRQWCAIAYWTGLRLDNAIDLQCQTDQSDADAIYYCASKTKHLHVFPIANWIRPWLAAQSLPYSRANDHAQVLIRNGIAAACQAAKIGPWLPKYLRQRCLTEWSRANAAAGAILHGSGLRVLSHYVDPLSVLESAAPRVRLPACFGATVDDGEALLVSYKRLDPAGQQIVSSVAQRLAGAG